MITLRPLLLVVEDSDEDFDTVEVAMRHLGGQWDLRRALTGGDGMAMLETECTARPTVVFMDLNTPGTSGRDAIALIKSNTALATTPVIVVTTSRDPRDLRFCYASGANAYHVKPVAYPEHLQLLEDVMAYWLRKVVLDEHERPAV